MANVEIPHFAIPFRINGSRGAIVDEQDSDEEVLGCIETIIRYTQGDRPEKPDFGLPDQTFASPSPDSSLIQSIVGQWEERIGVEVDPAVLDKISPLIQKIKVEATNE